MATTVIIPVRNEEKTIGRIVRTFNRFPETKGNVYVGIDADTTDTTIDQITNNGGSFITTGTQGKGQVVSRALEIIQLYKAKISDRIILCDGDYTGLRPQHIYRLMSRTNRGMVIGIPDWPLCEVPAHVTMAWPRVSGFRYLPWKLIPADAHGYLLETQINLAAIKERVPIKLIPMFGLKSPFQWPLTEQRMTELLRDQEWGKENGIL